MPHDDHQNRFFRQSGWLMIANVAAGIMMWGVHLLSTKTIDEAEYGTVGKLLAATIIIPTIPLQMIFTREAAAALASGKVPRLVGMVRKTLALLTGAWAVFAIAILALQGTILTDWKISEPMTLWLFLAVALGSLVAPVFNGLLQGKQDFLWLGWGMMMNGIWRLLGAALLIFLVARTATSVMGGILAGLFVCFAIAFWKTRDLWTGPAEPQPTRELLREMLPLIIGFGGCQFLFSADPIFVGRFFSADDTGYYTIAGTLSRAIIWLVLPLVQVMFPKLVHSTATKQKSNLLALTIVGTAGLAVCGAVGLSLLAPWIVPLVSRSSYAAVAVAIIPWYAGAMVPLSLANVLVNNLLAKGDFRFVPWLAVVAVGYGVTLGLIGKSAGAAGTHGLAMILQILAGFTTLLFVICAFYTWGPRAKVKVAY